MRRANHDKVVIPNIVPCAKCGQPSLMHRVCGACGFYKDRQVVAIKEDKPSNGATE